MPAPTDRRKFAWAIAAVIAFGIGGITGIAHMIWVALEKVASGQGLETYRTVWLVEFNYVGFLVMVGAVIVALLFAGAHWLHEWWQVRSLEKNMVPERAIPNPSIKALPPVAGTRRKRRAPYLKR